MKTKVITRFAPSPTGPLHLGHAYAAIVAHDMARAAGGDFLLRIEDIDQTRARPEWEALIKEDLLWLGLRWDGPIMRQSERLPAYRAALQDLWARGLIYDCHCTRRDIAEAASAPQEGATPLIGPDGLIYPGTCRRVHDGSGPLPGDALRLNMRRALDSLTHPVSFTETGAGPDGQSGVQAFDPEYLLGNIGDVVLARRDMGTSYHLAVVLDDAAQRITHVTRGADLFEATPIHVLLQGLLGLPTPLYHHHRLIRDDRGKRLAKRDDARAIATYRAEGKTPDQVRAMIGA
ncbi:MAG: tRNA glutamyl-Q(34) synthetase GluQRS [Paracoccaceae bacterium]|nr:tRNA glutamyl-Q(34) synthetase GluQRS [Paracoccaceae bacterium]MDP5366684.1 tRNA glutamyl-Q(34) synthetase GluQRS [Paracoccaceae bacterium]